MMKVYFAILKTHLEGKKWIRQFVKISNFKTHLQDDAYRSTTISASTKFDETFFFYHLPPYFTQSAIWMMVWNDNSHRSKDSIGLNKNLLENQSRYPRAIAHPSTVKVKLIAKLKLTFFQDWKLGTRFWQKLF
jgi:hypothetical protein